MVKYIDKTDSKFKSLEVSFLGMDETEIGKEVPKTSNVSVRLLESQNEISGVDIPYLESWTKSYSNILVPTGVWNGMKLGQITDSKIFVALGTYISELDKKNGEIIWTKSYAETSINFIKLASKNDAIYILYSDYKFTSNKIKSNLIKIDLNGNVIWSALTKDKDDSFTSFNCGDDGLKAFTWNCWALKLNEETGEIIDAQWTK
jgi:outer membrane protein assembly factor BamB